MKMIVMYQKIRTNGKGSIRIDKALCDELYEIGEDFLIAQMKYSPRKSQLFQMTSNGIQILVFALSTTVPGHSLKIRASRQSKFLVIEMERIHIRVMNFEKLLK